MTNPNIYKNMDKFLTNFNCTVSGESGQYVVEYVNGEYSGVCKYVEVPGNKFQPGPVLLMTECEMGDVIEWRHKMCPLTTEEFTEVNMYIRFDSLYRVMDHVSGGK